MFLVRCQKRQKIQDGFNVTRFRRRVFKTIERHCQPVRKPFGPAVVEKAVLRQRREYHLPPIETVNEILRTRFGRDRTPELRGHTYRREGHFGNRRHFTQRRHRKLASKSFRRAGQRARSRRSTRRTYELLKIEKTKLKIFVSYLDSKVKSRTFQRDFCKINMGDISKDVSEKFRKLLADQQKKIQQQKEQIRRLKQQQEEKTRLFKAKEQEKIRRLKEREKAKRQKAMEQIRQRELRKVQREIEKEERRRVKVARARLEKETRKWDREMTRELERRRKLVSNEPSFELIKTGSNANARFTTYFDSYRIKINRYPIEPPAVFKAAMEKTINDRGLVVNDRVRLIVNHHSWHKPFSTKLLKVTKGKNFIYNLIKAVLEFVEYKSVPLNELLIEVQSTRVPRGSGRVRIDLNNVSTKRSIICIKNNDTMCLASAIVTAHANINKLKWTKSQLKNGFNASKKLQEDEARKLHENAGVEISDHGNTLEDVNTFAKHLGVQINIVDAEYFNEIIHATEGDIVDGNVIYLYKNKNHYDVITSMPGFLGKKYYCDTCKKSYTKRDKH